MSIFDRLFRIGKANVNAAIDKIEDPVKIIDQVLRELDEDVDIVTAAVTSQMAVEKRFER
ncbi:MAG TPA: PspA/IM30 family protein, partial [Candidatus Paenibacillus intestinavium]|nr:PspA/IM30 family protein [Candidatus Paenibacillus intestinavium]